MPVALGARQKGCELQLQAYATIRGTSIGNEAPQKAFQNNVVPQQSEQQQTANATDPEEKVGGQAPRLDFLLSMSKAYSTAIPPESDRTRRRETHASRLLFLKWIFGFPIHQVLHGFRCASTLALFLIGVIRTISSLRIVPPHTA
jgi:hypothetical protein